MSCLTCKNDLSGLSVLHLKEHCRFSCYVE
jgi:hypothetical protein